MTSSLGQPYLLGAMKWIATANEAVIRDHFKNGAVIWDDAADSKKRDAAVGRDWSQWLGVWKSDIAQCIDMTDFPSPLPPGPLPQDPWTYYSRYSNIKIRYSDYGDYIPRQIYKNLCQQAEAEEESHFHDTEDLMPRTPLIYLSPIAKLVVMPSSAITWEVWGDVVPLLEAFAIKYQGVELRFEVHEMMGRQRRLVTGGLLQRMDSLT
ncbi:hypothetical protein G7Y79_00009g025530 [Physcia stellaris]|nr:hypothetical protein G7Y79_00009g025530 [Physcia stellaris]